MILMFFTTYIDSHGQERSNSQQIAFKYVKSVRFLADFLAILGTGFITNYFPSFVFFGIFKMIRVFRIGVIIKKLNIP